MLLPSVVLIPLQALVPNMIILLFSIIKLESIKLENPEVEIPVNVPGKVPTGCTATFTLI